MRDLPVTLRAYFAAHAPAAPESWFEVNFAEKRPEPRAGAKWCEGCKAGGDCDGDADCEYMQVTLDCQHIWKDLREKAISTQWRWAWADAMIAAMGESHCPELKAVEALRQIVRKAHLVGGWRLVGNKLEPTDPTKDCNVHPDLIENARQALDKLEGGDHE